MHRPNLMQLGHNSNNKQTNSIMHRPNLMLCLFWLPITSGSIVEWAADTNFNTPANFKSGKLPCPKQTVIFPENLIGAIRFDNVIETGGLILPNNGELYIEGELFFGSDDKESNCSETENVYFYPKFVSSWSQPDVWISEKFNEATPDAERMPCFDDEVIFPDRKEFSLQLPESTQSIKGLKILDRKFGTLDFEDLVDSMYSYQVFVKNSRGDIGVEIKQEECMSRAGCPCQKHPLEPDCSLKYCVLPKCVHPVTPMGHCCKICGGYILFDIDNSFDISEFKDFVHKIIENYGENALVYHIARLPENKVQLVVVDTSEYSGVSAEVVNEVNHRMAKLWASTLKYYQISGSPLSKEGLGAIMFISMFFVVIIAMGVIYAYYYKLPEMRYPLRFGYGSFFSGVQRRTDSVVSLTRRDSMGPASSGARSSFRNPMYDSKKGSVQVVESSTEEN